MRKLFLVFGLIFLASCGTYKDSIKFPGYESAINNASLAVVTLPQAPIVANPSDVIDDLGEGTPEVTYFNYYKNEFTKNIKTYSSFREVEYLDKIEGLETIETSIKLPNDSTIVLNVPKEGTIFNNLTGNPEYILFVEDLTVFTNRRSFLEIMLNPLDKSMMGIPYSSSDEEALHHGGKYFIWDNQKGKIATCGTIFTKTFFNFLTGLRKSVWDASMHHLARNVLRNSPLRNEKANYKLDHTKY